MAITSDSSSIAYHTSHGNISKVDGNKTPNTISVHNKKEISGLRAQPNQAEGSLSSKNEPSKTHAPQYSKAEGIPQSHQQQQYITSTQSPYMKKQILPMLSKAPQIVPAIAPKPIQKVLPKISPQLSSLKPQQPRINNLPMNSYPNSSLANNNYKGINIGGSNSPGANSIDAKPFIITSKQWILPPRPKPGRKPNDHPSQTRKKHPSDSKNHLPTSQSSMHKTNSNAESNHTSTNDMTTQRETNVDSGKSQSLQYTKKSPNKKTFSTISSKTQKPNSIPIAPARGNASTLANLNPLSQMFSEEGDNFELKVQLLNKVKENENLKNLINTLKCEINNLNFLQNGCIDLKVLNKKNTSSYNGILNGVTGISSNASSVFLQNLDSIENVNDLNKLSENLMSSNDIKSYECKDIEKMLGDTLKSLNLTNYSESCRKKLKRSTTKIIEEKPELSEPIFQNEPKRKISLSNESFNVIRSNTEIIMNSNINKNKDEYLINNDEAILNEINNFDLNKMDLDNDFDCEMDDGISISIGATSSQKSSKKKPIVTESKIGVKNGKTYRTITPVTNTTVSATEDDSNYLASRFKNGFKDCGFCTNNTPCLCLEAEYELKSVKNYLNNKPELSFAKNPNLASNGDNIKIEKDDEMMCQLSNL